MLWKRTGEITIVLVKECSIRIHILLVVVEDDEDGKDGKDGKDDSEEKEEEEEE